MINGVNEYQKLVELYLEFQNLYNKAFETKNKPIKNLKGCFISFFGIEKNDDEFLTLGMINIKKIRKELKEIEKDYNKKSFKTTKDILEKNYIKMKELGLG